MNILCIGDSLTAGYGVPREQCWVSLLDRQTQHHWQNAGISGDTTPGMLARLQQLLPSKPDLIIWMGGINDILLTGSADQAKCCTMAFVNQCAAAGIRPVIGIPFLIRDVARPWNKLCDLDACIPVLEEYILWLLRLCDAAMLRKVDFRAAGECLLSDGMHPDPRGHRMMADAVLASLHLREASL